MSSHREAPEISKDPVADSTDMYAFVSPDRPDTVTLITNYIPLEDPAGGPNFFEFGDDVLYAINIDNDGDGKADITYEFRFTTRSSTRTASCTTPARSTRSTARTSTAARRTRSPRCATAAGRRSAGTSRPRRATSASARRRTTRASPTRRSTTSATASRSSPASASTASTSTSARSSTCRPAPVPEPPPHPDAGDARRQRAAGVQRAQHRHPGPDQPPDRGRQRRPTDPWRPTPPSACGRRRTARRRRFRDDERQTTSVGPFTQVSRLGNPLFNEVIVPMGRKDEWNRKPPHRDSEFAKYVAQPELAKLLPVLYPGVFPNLAALHDATAPTCWRSCSPASRRA